MYCFMSNWYTIVTYNMAYLKQHVFFKASSLYTFCNFAVFVKRTLLDYTNTALIGVETVSLMYVTTKDNYTVTLHSLCALYVVWIDITI